MYQGTRKLNTAGNCCQGLRAQESATDRENFPGITITAEVAVMSHPARRQPFAVSLLLSAMQIGRHTSELQSLMRISYAVFCLKKKNISHSITNNKHVHLHQQIQ